MPIFICPKCSLAVPMKPHEFPLHCRCGYVATDFLTGRDTGDKPTASQLESENSLTAADLPCPHRSPGPVGTVPCKLCGGREKEVPLYTCELHGHCTISRVNSGTAKVNNGPACCLGCPDLPPNSLSPQATPEAVTDHSPASPG